MTPVTALASKRDPVVKPRVAPPAACTTARQVHDHALVPVMHCRALADYQALEHDAIRALTTDARILDALDRLAVLAVEHKRAAEDAAAFLDVCEAKLKEAESKRDWDGLTSQEISGRQIAEGLNSCLDPLITNATDQEARRALWTWFERYERSAFAETRVVYAVGVRRRTVLDREYQRWQSMQETGS